MAKIAFITRGDEEWGMGHLHRLSWMLQDLRGSGLQDMVWRVFCRDAQPARRFPWPAGELTTLTDTPVELACAWQPDLAIVDWLDSMPAEIAMLAATGARVALLDDYGPAQNEAQLVVNALLSPLQPADYTVGQARILSGAPYVQFPPHVSRMRGVADATLKLASCPPYAPLPPLQPVAAQGPVQAVLVSFGGQVVSLAVALALEALAMAHFAGKVIVMPAHQAVGHHAGLPAAGVLDIEWLPAGPGFHDILAASDLAILAGGLSLYEAAFLGVPAICIALKEHQAATARKLEAAGACRFTGALAGLSASAVAQTVTALLHSSEARGTLSAHGLKLFDGFGLQRTLNAILSLID